MAGQSFAMGEAFGKGFQYGKRRISAMTNEQFNAMSAKDHFEETTADISAMIPSMKSQMNNFSTLQTDIIKTLIEQLKDAGIQIGEAVASGAGEVFAEGPAGGTAVAQSSLDNLRSIVGLPPLYANLVKPAGMLALLSWWENSNLLGALRIALNPSTWIFNEIKKIFNQSPPQNTVIDVLKWMQNRKILVTGPQVPSGGIQPPDNQPDNTFNPDTGINKDTRVPTPKLRAPSSIVTAWKKLKEELRLSIIQLGHADKTIANQTPSPSINALRARAKWKANIQRVTLLIRALENKYDLN